MPLECTRFGPATNSGSGPYLNLTGASTKTMEAAKQAADDEAHRKARVYGGGDNSGTLHYHGQEVLLLDRMTKTEKFLVKGEHAPAKELVRRLCKESLQVQCDVTSRYFQATEMVERVARLAPGALGLPVSATAQHLQTLIMEVSSVGCAALGN